MIRINNLKIKVEEDNLLEERIIKKLKTRDIDEYKIIKKSIDAYRTYYKMSKADIQMMHDFLAPYIKEDRQTMLVLFFERIY